MTNSSLTPYMIASVVAKAGLGCKLERVFDCMAIPCEDYEVCPECGEPEHEGDCEPAINVTYCINFN
jgi:hypothetical protein